MTDTQKLAARVIAAMTTRSIGAAYEAAAQQSGRSLSDCVDAYLTEVHLKKMRQTSSDMGVANG